MFSLAVFFNWFGSLYPMSHSESIVFDYFLSGDDPRFELLRKQISSAKKVRRRWLGKHTYALSVPFTYENLLIPLQFDIVSATCWSRDKRCKELLRFQLTLLRGGFVGPLIIDSIQLSQWRSHWEIDDTIGIQADFPDEPPLTLPSRVASEKIIESLLKWLGIADSVISENQANITAYLPSTGYHDSVGYEILQSLTISSQLREFYSQCDGIEIRDLLIYGLGDIYQTTVTDRSSGVNVLCLAEFGGESIIDHAASFDGIVCAIIESDSISEGIYIWRTKECLLKLIADDLKGFLRDIFQGKIALLSSRNSCESIIVRHFANQ